MKKSSIYYFSLAAIVAGSFVSCQDYEPFDEETVKEAAIAKEFISNFEKQYGKIAYGHTWGFGDVRNRVGLTRAEDTNRNQWPDPDYYNMTIPGYPDVYYNAIENRWYGIDGTDKYYRGANGYSTNASSVGIPAGDVTDEEIEYVSCWFRTHRYPESVKIHWTDFFAMDLSADNDRDANGYVVNRVPAYRFTNDNIIRAQEVDNFSIDQYAAQTFDGSGNAATYGTSIPGYDHINNFNHDQANFLPTLDNYPTQVPMSMSDYYMGKSYPNRMITLHTGSGTEDFAVHYSNDEAWRFNGLDGTHKIWALVHLHFTGKSGRVYDGYYLGFDYLFYKTGDEVQELIQDGYYSNWIFKLAMANPDPEDTYTTRVMCEDLGTTKDFDYNDVVFDVRYLLKKSEYENYKVGDPVKAVITLQAAGGTMPIYVGLNPKDSNCPSPCEAHKLLGQSTTDYPVNIGENYAKAPAANYTVTTNSLDPRDIKVYVQNTVNGVWYDMNEYAEEHKYEKGGCYVPLKFGVPTSVLWLQEDQPIHLGYDRFSSWVNDPTTNRDWYTSIVNNGEKLWGVRGEQSLSYEEMMSSSANTEPYSIGHKYDVYLRKGIDGDTKILHPNVAVGQNVWISIPEGYEKCSILGSYKMGEKDYRMNSSEINVITEDTQIEVYGPVYVLATPPMYSFQVKIILKDVNDDEVTDWQEQLHCGVTIQLEDSDNTKVGVTEYGWNGNSNPLKFVKDGKLKFTITNTNSKYQFVGWNLQGKDPSQGVININEDNMRIEMTFKASN